MCACINPSFHPFFQPSVYPSVCLSAKKFCVLRFARRGERETPSRLYLLPTGTAVVPRWYYGGGSGGGSVPLPSSAPAEVMQLCTRSMYSMYHVSSTIRENFSRSSGGLTMALRCGVSLRKIIHYPCSFQAPSRTGTDRHGKTPSVWHHHVPRRQRPRGRMNM